MKDRRSFCLVALLSCCLVLILNHPLCAQLGSEEAPPVKKPDFASPDMVDQEVVVITDDLGKLEKVIPLPEIEPLEVSVKPYEPVTGVPQPVEDEYVVIIHDEKNTGFDYSGLIDTDLWLPKVDRTETGVYYVAGLYDAGTHNGLRVMKNTGDPALDDWQPVLSFHYNDYDIAYLDIEVISDQGYGYILYEYGNHNVACIRFELANPSNITAELLRSNPSEYTIYCSLTSDDVEFTSDIYLYATWREGTDIRFKRSLDMGVTWQDEQVIVSGGTWFMMTGNSIAYCPADNKVYVLFEDYDQDIRVKESYIDYGAPGIWFTWLLMSSSTIPFTAGSITSNYQGYILATAHAEISVNGDDICWVYSSNAGQDWSSLYTYPLVSDQRYPSCASSQWGYFSMIYYYDHLIAGPRMMSRRTFYDNLGSSSWDAELITTQNTYLGMTDACIDYGYDPDHGGVWSTGTSSTSDSYFGWGGSAPPIVPEIVLSADLLDFDSVLVGEQADLPLTIYNEGNADLILYDLSCGTSVFSTNWDPADSLIQPGGSLGIMVTFAPQTITAYEDLLTIENNDEEVDVTLQGVGIGPTYPDFEVDLTYVSGSPVPPGGGNVYFDVYLSNNSGAPQDFDAWLDVGLILTIPTTVVQRSFTNFLAGWAINRPNMFFPVPGSYAPGSYMMYARCGEYPNVIWAQDTFPFIKSGDSDDNNFIAFIPDQPFPNPFGDEGISAMAPEIPEEFSVIGAYPNPFNPSTVISYQLPVVSLVNLSVYDLASRKVAVLVAGWRAAGLHESIYDAAGLPSGIYIYRLTAGRFTASGKIVLMK